MLDALADWIDDRRHRPAERRGGRLVRAARAAEPRRERAARAHRRDRLGARRELRTHGPRSTRASPRCRPARRSTSTPRTPEVIAAAIPDLAGDKLASFVAERARKPFTTIAELRERLPRGVTLPEGSSFAFSSSYFLVTVRSRQGDSVAQARALLKRDGRAWPTVVWQTLE